MKQNHIEIKSYPFQEGVSEHHVMIHVQDRMTTYSEQLKQVFGDLCECAAKIWREHSRCLSGYS